jgi:hypothetical protein
MKKMHCMVCLLALAVGIGSLFASRYHNRRSMPSSRSPDRALPSPQGAKAIIRAAHASSPRTPSLSTAARTPLPTRESRENLPLHAQASFSLPMAFEPNVGQANPQIQWIGRGRGLSVFLTHQGIDLQVPTAPRAASDGAAAPRVLRLTLASKSPLDWAGQEELPGRSNYFVGNDPRLWHTNVPHFAKAETHHSARTLGVSIYDNGEDLEYDLSLPPGADARKIRLRIAGAEAKHLASDGDLLLTLGANTITIGRPAIFEDSFTSSSSGRRKVSGGFVLEADGSVGIRVGAHDRRAGLLVDPSISVSYATFLGGSGSDTAASVAVDPSGKIYVGGTTTSASSFTETGMRIGDVDGPSEFFIAKIDPSMTGSSSLVYLTFLGGTGAQTGGLLALDSSGDVAVTGTTTAADFPVTGGSLPTTALTSGQGDDVIVSELDPTGSQLVFSVFFGGTGTESVNAAGGIAIGPGGSVYIASDTNPTSLNTNSPDLPVTV